MVLLLFDMLKIFILAEQREYQRNLTLHILCLLVGSGSKSPFWNFFKVSQPALNEDLCERELSSLARAVSNDTTGARLDFCDKQFKLGSFVRNILARWENDRVTDNRNTKWNGSKMGIARDDPDLHLVSQFFLLRIRQMSAPALFLSYTGDPKTWKNQLSGHQSKKHILSKEMLVPTSGHLHQLLDDVKRLVTKPWDLDLKTWIPDLKSRPHPDPVQASLADIPDIEELFALPPPACGGIHDLLVDEHSENEEERGPFRGDLKKDYVPPHLRTSCIPLAEVNPLDVAGPDEPLLTSRARRSDKPPRKSRAVASLAIPRNQAIRRVRVFSDVEEEEESKDDSRIAVPPPPAEADSVSESQVSLSRKIPRLRARPRKNPRYFPSQGEAA